MKYKNHLVWLTIVALTFSFSCGKKMKREPGKGSLPLINTPPNAVFSVDTLSGTTSTTFKVDASGSYDAQDSIQLLQVRWDWENDGTYDTDWTTTKLANHQYSTVGTKAIKLEVKDTNGLTDTEVHQLTIKLGDNIVIDINGNAYRTVTIGNQIWMAENLKVTHYRNGDPIPNVTNNREWSKLSTGAYCDYNNDVGYVATFGRLYNWFAVIDKRNIAPEGWHVASDEDWKQMERYLEMSRSETEKTGVRGTNEGSKIKEKGNLHWKYLNTGATNETGFTALPGGYRQHTSSFDNIYSHAYFWTSTEYNNAEGWHRRLRNDLSKIFRDGTEKRRGFSVRCVKD